MGTKVEGKTHRPGYFAMEDFSVNSNGNWLQYREEKKPNGHMYDRFTIVPANRSTEYDKEMLKRTMLIHEDTFRKQVNELHRLYKIQKDLMAQFQRADFNGHSRPVDKSQLRSFSSQAPSGDAKSIWQIEPCTSGHDNKHPSFYFMKERGFQCSSSGAPSRPSDNRFTKKILDLQLPADAYVDNDDVEILEAVGSSSRTNGSVLGGNVNLNHGDKQGLSSGDMSWISIDLRSQHGSIVSVASKPVERPSDTKITDFLGLGAFTSPNQCYSSRGENLNFLGLAGNGKEKHITEASGSFGPNEQTRHNNLFSNKQDDHNVSVAWIKHKPHGSDTSRGHYFGCPSTPHRPILASAASFSPVRSPWETSNTNKSYIEPSVAQNGLCNFFSVGSFDAPNPLLLLNIPGECHYPKHLQHDNCLMDVNLNSVPPHRVQDGTTIRNVEYGCDNSQVDISWLRKKPADLTKSDGHSQIVFRSTVSSEGTPTRILGFAISDAAEKGSQLLSIRHIDANCTPSAMHDAGPEMLDQCKKVGTSVRNLIDLNAALPCMDDLEVHVRQQKDAIVSQEPSDPSNDSLAIAAAENLLAMSKDVLTVSPQPDTLHWFAKLAISNENTMIYCSTGDQDDEFEAMILQLEETKGYEYSPTPRASEENKEKHNCAASLLLARPRRGQARRRRQKKDFQKDILLGLASLSRHEVSEDLQTLGRSMPVAPTRQGGSQPRGRRRPRNAAVTTEEVQVSPPPVPPALAATDLDVGRRGIMGWGRTTRRCHRTRCPPANNASVHLG